MSRWALSPIGTPNDLARLTELINARYDDLNLILGELEQLELELKGISGYTPKYSNSVDMQGMRVTNAGVSVNDNDYITRKEARAFGLYSRGNQLVSRRLIMANGGIQVPRAVTGPDSLPLNQARQIVTEELAAALALFLTQAHNWTAFQTFLVGAAVRPRVTTVADATSITFDLDTTDVAYQANTQAAGTLTLNAPTGSTAYDMRPIEFRLKLTNSQTPSFNAAFRFSTDAPAPTTLLGGFTHYLAFKYNLIDTKWDYLAKNFGF